MRITLFRLFAGLLIMFAIGSGCNKSSTNNRERQNTPKGDTTLIGENLTIPDNFTTDLPRYPNATTRIATADSAQGTATLNQDTSDSLETAKTWLTAFFTNAGFAPNVLTDTPDFYLAAFDKSEIHIQVQLVRDPQKQATNMLMSRTTKQ